MAIVSTESLPLKYKYPFTDIGVTPFTYKSLLDYLEGMPSNPSDLYLYDLTWLVRDDQRFMELLIPDAEYLVFLKKAISIDSDLNFLTEVTCPICGKLNKISIKGTDLSFSRPAEAIIYDGITMELMSGTLLCKLPTVKQLLTTLELCNTYGVTKHLELIKSLAMVNERQLNPMQVESMILNASREDVVTIYNVYNLLYKSLQPLSHACENKECELHNINNGGMSIEINALIGNVFRTLLFSKPVNRDKIYIK